MTFFKSRYTKFVRGFYTPNSNLKRDPNPSVLLELWLFLFLVTIKTNVRWGKSTGDSREQTQNQLVPSTNKEVVHWESQSSYVCPKRVETLQCLYTENVLSNDSNPEPRHPHMVSLEETDDTTKVKERPTTDLRSQRDGVSGEVSHRVLYRRPKGGPSRYSLPLSLSLYQTRSFVLSRFRSPSENIGLEFSLYSEDGVRKQCIWFGWHYTLLW